MGRIRVIGRRRQPAACAFCREYVLDEAGASCGECGVVVHPACQEELSRCPTIGCGGTMGLGPTRPRSRRRAVTPLPGRMAPLPERPPARRLGARPGLAARAGPYLRLTLSTVLNALLSLGILVGFVGFLVNMPEVIAHLVKPGGAGTVWNFVLAGGFAFVAFLFLWGSLAWLVHVPGVFAQIGALLDEDEPLRMRLTVTRVGTGKHKRYYAGLRSPERTAPHLHFKLNGILPPFWLTSTDHRDAHVWVYGVDGAPPYIIEFDDGWLALVHPDDA